MSVIPQALQSDRTSKIRPRERLIQNDRKGCMLYPMSGADITPLLIFPNVDSFVFVDEHLFLNEADENKIMSESDSNVHVDIKSVDSVVDSQLISDIMAGYKNFSDKDSVTDSDRPKFPLSFPMFSSGSSDDVQYDFSSPYSLLFRADVLSITNPYVTNQMDKGIVHLMITRIRDHTNFDVKKIMIVIPRYVYRIDLVDKTSGSEKTLYYTRELIMCEGDTYSTDWIQAQGFLFETLLIKGDPYYANFDPTNTIKASNRFYMKTKIASLCGRALSETPDSFRLVTDQKHRNGAFASLTSRVVTSTEGVHFGYDMLMAIYGPDAIREYLPVNYRINQKRESKVESDVSVGVSVSVDIDTVSSRMRGFRINRSTHGQGLGIVGSSDKNCEKDESKF
ncbi:hypothetical protein YASMINEVIRUS_65 [Yasminevirus sp. GU-2018]|uniref:Uncharacterized protein n=1 Tax=Yasminevirus sp. GU-2018 TaxID=2420051 RepID=A0A5K0U891_9VIRU|nr:hypothetical protein YASMINEVIRUS_65 [Yasminevirus sp. GU-2018]